jgi:hypothetical protein
VNHERTQIMEKARAKRRRRKASRRGKAAAPGAATSLTGKVVELAQGTAAQMGAFVKSAACKITCAGG